MIPTVAQWPGGGLKSKVGAKICNEILYKICNFQLVNKFKNSSNSGISIAIQLSNSFWQ